VSRCRIRIAQAHYELLQQHLFPGDDGEHGAVLKAGVSQVGSDIELLVREVHLACEGEDYVPSRIGYRALTPPFIHKHITKCRDQRLAYLAVHNHMSTDSVDFSRIDFESHERGYPALRDIAAGMPVGALVFGTESVQADVWMPDGSRRALSEALVIGSTLQRLYPRPVREASATDNSFDRQVRLLGHQGQKLLASSKVAVIGLGGVGSLVAEYLARLGIGHLVLIDPDRIESTNLSRVVGATEEDVRKGRTKVEIAQREAKRAHPAPQVTAICDDVANDDVARQLRHCDYIFLAADSMRARLVFNSVCQQYMIPGVQLGAKVAATDDALQIWSAVRPVRPMLGCLWCNGLVDPHQLALESKSDEERKAQAYGVQEPNPSVITLNAVAAAHGVNDFLFDYLGLRNSRPDLEYRLLWSVGGQSSRVLPRRDADCCECSNSANSRFAFGDGKSLPTLRAE
jgi:hypothetical protein